jgi:hypothetical protein
MDVEAPFVANGESAETVHPREGALDDPAVSAEFLAAFNATPGDGRFYAEPIQVNYVPTLCPFPAQSGEPT